MPSVKEYSLNAYHDALKLNYSLKGYCRRRESFHAIHTNSTLKNRFHELLNESILSHAIFLARISFKTFEVSCDTPRYAIILAANEEGREIWR